MKCKEKNMGKVTIKKIKKLLIVTENSKKKKIQQVLGKDMMKLEVS